MTNDPTRLVDDPVYDADDLAVSVFDALSRAAREGRYENLPDRAELWSLLVTVARRKMVDRRRRTNALIRSSAVDTDLQTECADPGTSPEWDAELADECRYLVEILDDDRTRQVALLRLEQHTNQEIADELKLSERSIRRMVSLVRRTWEHELDQVPE